MPIRSATWIRCGGIWSSAINWSVARKRVGSRTGRLKIHIALTPVYYQNYELGYLVAYQFDDRLQRTAGGIVGQKKAGRWSSSALPEPGPRKSGRASPDRHRRAAQSQVLRRSVS